MKGVCDGGERPMISGSHSLPPGKLQQQRERLKRNPVRSQGRGQADGPDLRWRENENTLSRAGW